MKTVRTLFRLIVTLLLVIGWGLAASALHVIWTGDKPLILPKERLGVRDTYVNVSNWTADDVAAHPIVSKRLVATGHADVLAGPLQATGEQLVEKIAEAIAKGPTTQPAPTVVDKVQHAVQQAKATIGQ
jgi:hypothetical protein